MLRCRTENEKVVALLHDVVEKSDRTFDELRREGFAPEVIAAVERLTKREGEPYLDYIVRARENPLARAVKQADLQDHVDVILDLGRADEDPERMRRYQEAMRVLHGEQRN
jgi:(p)ppGpp synthase/HD superfamily hydrolase